MSDVPTIYLARHGETEWSKSGQHTSLTDIPLTAAGEAAATKIGSRLAGITFARVYSSPLQRARRTAELAGFTPDLDRELLEWNYGECEAKKTVDIRKTMPGWDLFRDGAPGGESVQQVSDRADGVVNRIKAMQGNILLFAHGHILRVLAARWVGQPVAFGRALLLSTATVSVLSFDHHQMDEPAIKLWNDDRHI